MDGLRLAIIHFLTKSAKGLFHNAQKEAILQKKFLKSVHRGKSAKMAIWQYSGFFAIMALLPLCTDFKISFAKWLLFEHYEKVL